MPQPRFADRTSDAPSDSYGRSEGAAIRASLRQSGYGMSVGYGGLWPSASYGESARTSLRTSVSTIGGASAIRFASQERDSIDLDRLGDGADSFSGSSNAGAEVQADRISALLASQQRIEQQLRRLGLEQKDACRYILEIHRVVAGHDEPPFASDRSAFSYEVTARAFENAVDERPDSTTPDGHSELVNQHKAPLAGSTVCSMDELDALEPKEPLDLHLGHQSSETSTVVSTWAENDVTPLTDPWNGKQVPSPLSSPKGLLLSEAPWQEVDKGHCESAQGPRELAKPIVKVDPDDGPLNSEEDDDDQISPAWESSEREEFTRQDNNMSTWSATLCDLSGTVSTFDGQRRRSSRLSAQSATGKPSLERSSSSVSRISEQDWEETHSQLSSSRLITLLEESGSVFSPDKTWRPPPSLPQEWPGMLKLHPALSHKNMRSSDVKSLYIEDARSVHGHDMLAMEKNVMHERVETAPWLAKVMMRPMSLRRILLDVVGLLVLGYDLFLTPFMLAWELPLVGFLRVFGWISVTFWMIDVLASFSTGYYRNGVLEMRPNKVAYRYLQSWFVVDMTVIICDWFSLLSGSGRTNDSKAAGVVRFSKLSRLVRIVTVLRLTRLADISVRLTDWGITQRWTIIAEITKLLLAICWISHAVSCAWFAVGVHLSSDTGGKWIWEYAMPERRYIDMPISYQYTTSLHWSLAQITPGSMSVSPVNTGERIFNVVCLLCGLFFFTSLISSLSTKMVHFRMMKQEEAMMFVRLRKYLQQEGIVHQLAVLVQKQLRDRLAKQKLLSAEDVPAIALLSLSTRMELHFEVCKPHLRHYPFFHLWANIDVGSFRKFCFKAISFTYLPQGETLFLPGTQGKEAYHLCDGRLRYYPEVNSKKRPPMTVAGIRDVGTGDSGASASLRGGASASLFLPSISRAGLSAKISHVSAIIDSNSSQRQPREHGEEGIIVEPGAWLCEGALWTQWYHVGTAIAGSRCKLLTCNGLVFVKELMQHRLTRPIAMEYGASYHERLIRSFPPHSEAPDDLQVPHTSPEEIVIGLDSDTRGFVSSIAFNTLQPVGNVWMGKGKLAPKCTEELSNEVCEGKTVLTFDPSYTVKRVVQLSIAVIRMEDNFLIQLAKEEPHSRKFRFGPVYPGVKQDGRESPSETTRRLLETTLKPLLPGLTMGKNFLETEVKLSTRYNLQTKYLRTVQEITMDTSFMKQKRRFQLIKPTSSVHSGTNSNTSVRLRSLTSNTDPANKSDLPAQLTASIRSSIQAGAQPVESKHVLRRLRPRRVLQNVFGYSGEVDPVDIVDRLQLFVLRDDEGSIVCAWMTKADFAVLANPDNEDYLQHWFRDHVSVDDTLP